MTWELTPTIQYCYAIHEAAHAVLCVRIEFLFQTVSIGREPMCDIEEFDIRDFPTCCNLMVILWAGYIAEGLWAEITPFETRRGALSDWGFMSVLTRTQRRLTRDMRLQLKAKAERMVKANENEIRKVAVRLMTDKKLTQAQVKEILKDEHCNGCRYGSHCLGADANCTCACEEKHAA